LSTERKHPLARCEECPWKEHSTYAGESGPEDASLLVIGEAPGAQEAEAGTPFVGASGKLLDKVLAHHGLDRNEVRFTNVAACHPPFVRGQTSVAPTKEVTRACAPRLRHELQGRETVLLLGNTAKEAVLETREPITRVRQGPPRTLLDYPNTRFIATVHPAACLRSSDSFPSLVRDVGKIKSKTFIKWEPPKYAVFDEPDQATLALGAILEKEGPITVDIEVGVDKDQSFTHPNQLLCVGIGFAPNKAAVIGGRALRDRGVRETLTRVLNSKRVICHNGKFDLQVLMRLGYITQPRLYADTMLGSYVLDERPGQHGLKGLASEVLGAPDYASDIKRYLTKGDSYSVIPKPVLYRYNAFDAALTYNLWDQLRQRLNKDGLREVHDRLVTYSNELIYAELDGVAVDPDHLDVLTDEYIDTLDALENQLSRVAQRHFNPRSPKQVLEVMSELGIRATTTEAELLQLLFEKSRPNTRRHEFLRLMLKHRREQKLYGTYVKGTRKRLLEDRVYPTYLLHGSVSGRLACRNPNLQNVPRESSIRRLFVPEDGNIFVQGDYAQAELRVIACYAKDEYFRGALSDSSRDIHGEVAERFYGKGWTKDQRVRAKAVVFGLAYGREAASLAAEFRISQAEAQRFVDGFFQLIPDTVRWREDVKKTVFSSGQGLQTHFGRKRRFWLITRDNKKDVEKEALSFLPQSTANDICLSALVRLRQSFGDSVHAPRVRIPVHDSILVECSIRDRDMVAATMRDVMSRTATEEFSDFVPFPVDISVGDSWGTLKEQEL